MITTIRFFVREEGTVRQGQMSQLGANLESTTLTMVSSRLMLACLAREVISVTRLVLEVCTTTIFTGAHQVTSVSREPTSHSHAKLVHTP